MYTNTDKDNLINQIIDIEFSMFDKVNGLQGRAPCQNDKRTFYLMRYSQHQAFSYDTLSSYRQDLLQAQKENRNLITEKYAYMMEFTDTLYYNEVLKTSLPIQPLEKIELISEIMDILEEDFEKFSKKYPYFAMHGRPYESIGKVASINIYNLGELKTYSIETLRLYKEDLIKSRHEGFTTVEKIQHQTSVFYGYKDIQEAENTLKERIR